MSVWRDVRFDGPAAADAAAALRALAASLDAETDGRAWAADLARRDWAGDARRATDTLLAAEDRRAADLVEALRRAAVTIEAAVEEAGAEQRRRERRRQELVEQRIDRLAAPA